jgi:hypothetical protein
MTGCSFIVTVSAPKAPCAITQASAAVASHGERPPSRRQRVHDWTARMMISKPTPIAK